MANIIIPQVTVIDPTALNPNGFASGEIIILQRGATPTQLLAIYSYVGGAAALPDARFTPANGSAFGIQILNLLAGARGATFV